MGNGAPAIFLDFDGVLCDSVDECFASSWLALAPEARSIPIATRRLFGSYRPYIRRGADYLLLQYCIEGGVEIRRQEDFDREIERAGPERMEELDRRFYAARRALASRDPASWLSLNRPYPRLLPALKRAAASPLARILSTKRAAFIREIVSSWGIDWPLDRIHDSGSGVKGELIGSLLDAGSAETAVFVDDQIDHLDRLRDPRIRGYLALWGYVKPEWLERPGLRAIDQEGLVAMLGGSP